MNKKILISVVIVVFILIGFYLLSPLFIVKEMNEPEPMVAEITENGTEEIIENVVLLSGDFQASAHEVSGKAKVIEISEEKILRFEDFETVNGPNLHIYLSSDLDPKDYIDLGAIKATKGNVNYDIPEGTDLEKYNKVIVWCVPFKVSFSYAELG